MKDQLPPQDDPEAAHALALAAELRVVAGRLIRRLREQADTGDLTTSQKSALLHLEREGPATVTTLARAQDMRPQSMGAIVSALQLAGLVEGAPDPADGRQVLLSLTSACLDMIATGRAARQDWLFRAIQANLDREEQEQLAGAVELLKRLADS
ncbi:MULTISPECIES: MarR family winged helix-turn-helix transcriptional regulator [Mesorhizobium]|jgi:DNA-binding MarR family transcriptional regulator|uniref:MarR family transcriptional regulator n=1 Tax=Rhizobium loti TaxID=381 RepID=A0A6M7TYU6_RHILI|nr:MULTISPECIES: MarR family winged helix-turn-helix transcriptional regulator [Mesorhizobium]KRB19215.1 MarR family transcriptional regulator [Mesorhizobium sp. Root172]OBQ70847.1 MarR family transcriptional regulator [Mesorhizobium loti]QKC69650.1 MarR family transcriptional regulator [Mesorhizobium loti]QKC88940.1 MarR family transcriptional regulator [Mesorhizobium sp. NZP2234]